MAANVIPEPREMAVTIEMARTAARVNGTALDDEIKVHVGTATTEAEHYTGLVFIDRTYRITLDSLVGDIEMPVSPAREVVNFIYTDENGDLQELDPADYMLDETTQPGFLIPAFGKAWPVTRSVAKGVQIDVVCGFGPTPATVPDAVKGYILARLREIYAPPGTPESPHLKSGLQALKVY
jgi:uncharacterized phiE125 gp8 family phage protein